MKLSAKMLKRLQEKMAAVAGSRPPNFLIGGAEDPYMRRWWVIPRNKFFNIYLHHFLRSDSDEALHDHPWVNLSILLQGEYVEHTIAAGGVNRQEHFVAGDMKARFATAAHRVELNCGPCWSLFITGPVMRQWGFHCTKGWRAYKPARDDERVGACD